MAIIIISVASSKMKITNLVNFVCTDDSWLNITERDLDHMLLQAAPPPTSNPSQSLQHPPAESASSSNHGKGADLHSMVYGMKSFVEKESSCEGAEFPWYVLCIHLPIMKF